ncbi:hypothetical protein [Negadavirga shengliensis]|uniref:Outer membrane protein beta-barrel domain-containing protein n=1 Tax=Negadavirga shengliensis TaxID=1389218 RepID=A0ABV9SV47_9BACT
MKHILLLSSMFLVSHLTFAQFQKGDKFIGGSFHTEASRSQQKNDLHSRYMALNLNPTIGYFLSSSAAIGVIPLFSINRSTQVDTQGNKSNTTRLAGGLGFFYRKYFNLTENLYFFAQPKAEYLTNIKDDYDFYTVDLALAPGMAYRIGPKWMAELTLGGLRQRWTKSDRAIESKDRSLSLSLQPQATIGIMYFLKPGGQ